MTESKLHNPANGDDALPDDGDDELNDTEAGADHSKADADRAHHEQDRQLETGEENPS